MAPLEKHATGAFLHLWSLKRPSIPVSHGYTMKSHNPIIDHMAKDERNEIKCIELEKSGNGYKNKYMPWKCPVLLYSFPF